MQSNEEAGDGRTVAKKLYFLIFLKHMRDAYAKFLRTNTCFNYVCTVFCLYVSTPKGMFGNREWY